MKPTLVLDKSLVRDNAFDAMAPTLDARYQLVFPSHLLLEWVSVKGGREPSEGAMSELEAKLKLTPCAVACPIPSRLAQAELKGDHLSLTDSCETSLTERIRSGDSTWVTAERIQAWRELVQEGVDWLNDISVLVPRMLPETKQGDVDTDLLAQVAASGPEIAKTIWSDVWRPALGPEAPPLPGPLTAIRLQIFFLGAVTWFGKYGVLPHKANPSKNFNEVVDLDIRTLAVAFGGMGSLDGPSQTIFRLLCPKGELVR